MALYVVSERNSNQHVAWGTSYEFEDIIARTCDARILSPKGWSLHPKLDISLGKLIAGRYRRVGGLEFAREPNVLLLIGMGPPALRMLDKLGPWRRKCSLVAAYIIDLYPGALNRFDPRIVNKLDHLFISYEQMLEPVRARFKTPVTFIPQACDALGHGACGGNRPIDVVGYGRQIEGVHESLQKTFNSPGTGKVYFHSTFKHTRVKNWREDRMLFWKIMRRAKISLAYCFVETNRDTALGVSPLTARWFEAITAGCAIVGRRPRSPDADRLLDWRDAVIDLPEETRQCVPFLEALIGDTERMAGISRRNYLEALRRHDWRHRLRDMFDALGLPLPAGAIRDLAALKAKADELELKPRLSA